MNYHIIVSCTQDGGISKDGKIPWDLKEDMRFFRKTTIGNGNNAVIMGRKTYFSIPENHRPLKNRLNIVLTSNVEKYRDECFHNLIFVNSYDNVFEHIMNYHITIKNVFNIGGKTLYEMGFHDSRLTGIYLTKILDHYQTDEDTKCYFFDLNNLRCGYSFEQLETGSFNYERFYIKPCICF